jgi:hypothetical protein
MKFPGESAGEENEQVKLIVAGVFLCRLVIDERALNLVLIALRADIFFWIMDVIGLSYGFHRAMFGLFGDTDVDITTGGAIGVECSVEADSQLCSRSDVTGERLVLWPAPGSEDTELGVLMELEVGHGETEVYPRVQA